MKTNKLIVASALFAALAAFTYAEDAGSNSADLFADSMADVPADSSAGDSAAAGAFKLTLSGEHGFAYHAPVYFSDDNGDYSGDIKSPKFTNDFGAEVQDGKVKLVSHWEFDVSPLDASAQDPNGNWGASASITPLENYISWSPASLKLSAGYQIFSWGVADKRNPTDNLNPRDYTTGAIDPDKIPVLAADATWYASDAVSLEGVFIPSKGASQYPLDFARIIASKSEGLIPSEKLSYADNGADPANFVAGAKLNYKSSAFDLSLDYLYDIDQYFTPEFSGITLDAAPTSPTYGLFLPASVTLERKRVQRIGGDAKTTIGKFGLWLETAYSLTDNSGSNDWSERKSKLDYTLGTDVNFGPNDVGYVNLQYIGAWIPDYDSDSPSKMMIAYPYGATASSAQEFYERSMVNLLGLETEGLLQGVTCNVKYEIADALVTPQITAAFLKPFDYDDTSVTRYGSLALNPEIDVKPVDSFHILIGADLYYAWIKEDGGSVKLDTESDAVGSYTPSNNVYLKVVYKWNADIKK